MKTKQVLKMKPQPEMRKTKTFPRNLMTLSSKGRSVFYICNACVLRSFAEAS